MPHRPSRIPWLLLLLVASACGPKVATVRVPGEPAYAAAVRESLAAQHAQRIWRCASNAKFGFDTRQPLTSNAVVVGASADGAPSAFEALMDHPFLGEFEVCLGRALLDWKAPPAPEGRMATVRFHFRPEGTGLPEAAAARHPFVEVYGLWVDLEVQETERRAVPTVPPVWDASTMSEPKLASAGQAPWLSHEMLARLAGKMYVALCEITLDGELEDCKVLVNERYPAEDEEARAVIQRLAGRRYTPAVYKGTPVRVLYPFQVGFKER